MTRDDPRDPTGAPQEAAGEAHEPVPEEIVLDPVRLKHLASKIRDEQNLTLGALAGAVAATVGAILWAVVTWKTGYQIGFMAIGIGFLVGFAVRFAGRGIDNIFGVVGAALALIGVLAGNLLTASVGLAEHLSISVFEVLGSLDVPASLELLKLTFSPIDLLFYGFAGYEGYKLSVRGLTDDELRRVRIS